MKLPFKVMYFGNCTLEKWSELPCAGFTFSQVSPVQTWGFLGISDSSFSQWRTPGVTAAASMIYPVCPLSTHRLNGERQRWSWRCACTTLVYEESERSQGAVHRDVLRVAVKLTKRTSPSFSLLIFKAWALRSGPYCLMLSPLFLQVFTDLCNLCHRGKMYYWEKCRLL